MAFEMVRQVSELPAELNKLKQDQIRVVTTCGYMTNHYLQGDILKKFPVFENKKRKRMKMILQDKDGSKINVFCIDHYAEELAKCLVGDTLIVADAHVVKSPHYQQDGIHTHHIIIDNQCQPTVWVIPKSEKTTQVKRNSVPGSQRPATTANQHAAEGGNQQSEAITTQQRNQDPLHPPRALAPSGGTVGLGMPKGAQGLDAVVDRSKAQSASPSKSPNKKNYAYTNLKDVKETHSVNIYGVVKFFKPPYKTRGTDYCMVVTLIDPSLVDPVDPDGIDKGLKCILFRPDVKQLPHIHRVGDIVRFHRLKVDPVDPDGIDKGLKCILFRPDVKQLPHIHRVGDIVRFHRLKVQVYSEELQGMCRPGFASLVFEGRAGSPMKPRSSTAEYTCTQQDKDKVRELQRWSASLRTENLSNPNRRLSEVFIGQYFDLTCQVIAKAELPAESCVLLKVWDGSKCQWAVREIETNNATIEWDNEAAFRAEGLTVDVCLYDNHVTAGLKLKAGNYICLYNLHVANYSPPGDHPAPIGEFCLHRGTSYGRGVAVMSPWESDVKELIRVLDNVNRGITDDPVSHFSTNQTASTSVATGLQEKSASSSTNRQEGFFSTGTNQATMATTTRRLAFNEASNLKATPSRSATNRLPPNEKVNSQSASSHCMQRSASIITDHFHIKTSTIAEVKAHDGPSLFRIRARLSDFLPDNVEDFVCLYCAKCKFRCRVPYLQDSSKHKKSHAVTSNNNAPPEIPQTRSLRSKTKGTSHQPETSTSKKKSKPSSPRKTSNINSKKNVAISETNLSDERLLRRLRRNQHLDIQEQVGSDGEVNKIARGLVRGHNTICELPVNVNESCGHRTVRITMEGLSVHDALLLAHQGVKLQNPPTSQNSSNLQHNPASQVYYICPKCSAGSSKEDDGNDECGNLLQYIYCVKFFLEDNTDRIAVVLTNRHAETFFKNVPPVNLHVNLRSKFLLEDYMQRLCPYPVSSPSKDNREDSHPWLDACIMSYQSVHAGQPVMKYHMFHTMLALDVE